MKIRFDVDLQGKWEPERIAHALRVYATGGYSGTKENSAWAMDCATRIERQVAAYRKRKELSEETPSRGVFVSVDEAALNGGK